jgi:hypothetical protein
MKGPPTTPSAKAPANVPKIIEIASRIGVKTPNAKATALASLLVQRDWSFRKIQRAAQDDGKKAINRISIASKPYVERNLSGPVAKISIWLLTVAAITAFAMIGISHLSRIRVTHDYRTTVQRYDAPTADPSRTYVRS